MARTGKSARRGRPFDVGNRSPMRSPRKTTKAKWPFGSSDGSHSEDGQDSSNAGDRLRSEDEPKSDDDARSENGSTCEAPFPYVNKGMNGPIAQAGSSTNAASTTITGQKRKLEGNQQEEPKVKAKQPFGRRQLGQISFTFEAKWGDEFAPERFTMKDPFALYKDLEGMFKKCQDEVMERYRHQALGMSKHDSLPDNDLNLSRTVEAQGDSVEMKAEPEIRSLSDGRSLDTTHKEVALAKEARKKVQAEARLVEAQTKLQLAQNDYYSMWKDWQENDRKKSTAYHSAASSLSGEQ